jgi:hypothetical protein
MLSSKKDVTEANQLYAAVIFFRIDTVLLDKPEADASGVPV